MTTNIVSSDGWKLSRTLGAGGFGIVQLWVHTQTGKKLAIKKCKWDYSQLTPIQRKRWAKEVDIMIHLRHPYIVRTGCVPFNLPNVDESLPILCMEYCRKGDLRKILNEPENCCGINETEAIKVMIEISSAVEYLHSRNITHRDLKPENIVLQDENNALSYKLIDLGYAKELGEGSTSASLVGTLNYVAPELFWREKYSCSVDYWSLGILFYELVTGVRPFLPTMQHTTEWMKHIQNKDYDDIHAYQSDGIVVFGRDIQDPTPLSNYLRSRMVQWFRLVLQWDPHKRGKELDESGALRVTAFTMLRQALSKKILYVFCVPLYRINTYEIDSTTTVKELRLLIEKDADINVQNQVLTDYNGATLGESTTPVVSQVNDHILFVFRDGSFLMEDVPTPDIPAAVQRMMTQSKNELVFQVLKDCYRRTIFFAKEQVNLFQLYIFAFSINVDLLHQKINTFNENMDKTLESTKALMNKVHTNRATLANTTDEREALQTYFDKIDKLISAADQIKMKFISLQETNDRLKDKAQDTDYTRGLSESYNKMCDIYMGLKKESPRKTAKPLDMVKLVFGFLEKREAQLRNENIIDITRYRTCRYEWCIEHRMRDKNYILMKRQVDKLQDELSKLERIFNSVTVMTKLYWKEYWKFAQLDTNVAPQQSLNISTAELDKVIQSEDNAIYDNLILRYTLDNLMAEMQKKYFEVTNLDP